jgi:DNA uptake protein ComE-like DNA-binding protein
MRFTRLTLAATMAASLLTFGGVRAQVLGKGIMDFNTAAEKDLSTLPNITPAIVKGLLDKRPFASITEVNTYLLSQGLTAEQATAIYEKAFVHLNLNTCTPEEILLIPRARRMRIEFPEYRPWKTVAQFDKEIGKYVAQTPGELDRLKSYVFIPLSANAAADADFMTIPMLTPAILKAIKDGRPWSSADQLEAAIAKATNAKDAARIRRYLVVP